MTEKKPRPKLNMNSKVLDETGRRYGRWTVLRYAGIAKSGRSALWEVECSCTKKSIRVLRGKDLRSGASRSCGCLQRTTVSKTLAPDETGKRYGRWKVLSRAKVDRPGAYWKVRCTCPKKTVRIVSGRSLREGTSASCGCWNADSKLKDITAQKFGRWTVLERDSTYDGRDHSAHWWVKCSCAERTIKSVSGTELRQGSTQSCGCLSAELASIRAGKFRVDAKEAIINKLLASYKMSSKYRGYRWNLNKDDFKALIVLPCHYCGAPPSNKKTSKRTTIVYSGVDRVDNNKGYSVSNVVTCCRRCNIAKANRSEKEFLDWIRTIINFQQSLGKAGNCATTTKE